MSCFFFAQATELDFQALSRRAREPFLLEFPKVVRVSRAGRGSQKVRTEAENENAEKWPKTQWTASAKAGNRLGAAEPFGLRTWSPRASTATAAGFSGFAGARAWGGQPYNENALRCAGGAAHIPPCCSVHELRLDVLGVRRHEGRSRQNREESRPIFFKVNIHFSKFCVLKYRTQNLPF